MTLGAMADEYNALKQQMIAQMAELSERVVQVEGENAVSRKAIAQLKTSMMDQKILEIKKEKTEDIQQSRYAERRDQSICGASQRNGCTLERTGGQSVAPRRRPWF